MDASTIAMMSMITGSWITIFGAILWQSYRHEEGIKSVNDNVAGLVTRVTALETKVESGLTHRRSPTQTLTRQHRRNTLGVIYSPPAGRLALMPSPGGCFMSCARFAEAAKERAEIVKSQARNLYVTVSTVVLASISIWIALLAGPGA